MGKEEENRVSISSQSCLSLTITVPDIVLQHHQSPPGSSEAQRTLNLALTHGRPLKLWGIALEEGSATGTLPGVGNISLARV